MGQILSVLDVFTFTCKFQDDDDDNDGLLSYYRIPNNSEKSLERRIFIEKQIDVNTNK